MEKRVLIIGGNGFIGSNLIIKMLEENFKLHILDMSEAKIKEQLILSKINCYKGSIKNIDLIEKIFQKEKIDLVVHLANGIIPSSTFDSFKKEMTDVVIPTYELLEIMEKNNVNKIIFFSSGGTIYGNIEDKSEETNPNPISYYGYSKQIIENYLKLKKEQTNIEYLILRPSNPFGKYQNIEGNQGLIGIAIKKILLGEDIDIYGDGNNLRDYIFVEDLANIVCELIKKEKWNEIYNIGSGNVYSINEIINKIEKLLSRKAIINYIENRGIDVKKVELNIEKLLKELPNIKINLLDDSLKEYTEELKTKLIKK